MKKIILYTSYFILLLLLFPQTVQAAVTLSLDPASKTLSVGESADLKIILDTGGQSVTGGRAVLTYNSSRLQVLDASTTQAGVQVLPGTVWTNPITNIVDALGGKITLDYGASVATYSGKTTFGTMSVKALAAGTTAVSFVLTGAATGSAVFSGSTNLLSSTTNGTYTISSATSSPTPSVLPQSGSIENTIFLVILATIFLSSGIYLFKFQN